MDIIQKLLGGFFSFSSDVIIILVLIAIGSAYAYFMGKGRAVSLVLSFYPGILLYNNFPFFGEASISVKLVIFVVAVLLVHLVLGRFITANFPYSKIRTVFESLVLGLISAGLILFVSYHTIPIEKLYNFSPWLILWSLAILFSGGSFYPLFCWSF